MLEWVPRLSSLDGGVVTWIGHEDYRDVDIIVCGYSNNQI